SMLDGGDIKADAGSIPSITVSNPVLQSEAVNAAASRTPFRWEETRLPHIDYVLVYKRDGNERNEKLREAFLDVLKIKRPGIDTEEFEYDGEFGQSLVFLKVYTPFHVLAKEAERLKLEMALDKSISPLESFNLSKKIGQCLGLIEDDEPDYISGPFTRNRLHLFKGHENTETFFRPALRSYLTYNILINADIGSNVPDVDKDVSKTALPKLLHRGAFIDAFILHDPSADDPWVSSLKAAWFKRHPDDLETSTANLPNLTTLRRASTPVARLLKSVRRIGECRFDYSYEPDERRRLGQVWSSLVKYQPLDRVRNYFGEKVAFYFAWSGHMISMLWAPMLIGLAIFLYGLALSIERHIINGGTSPASKNRTADAVEQMMALVDDMLATVKEAFDNLLTPIFAIIICLWGTLHTEMWKRYRATLAYEWDVNNYKHAEPDRPEFVGTMERPDPITGKSDSYYPGHYQAMKFVTSFIILLLMICVVFIGVAAVIVYRIFVTIRVCPNVTSSSCLLLNAVVSSLLNAVFIIVIGKVYNNIAYALTNWENHRTQSDYDNALILKLFAFEFANSYSSLFYIAFFRDKNMFTPENGIFNLGKEFVDTCGSDGNCMSMLSLQVLILMIAKPMPKLFTDHGLPLLIRLYRYTRRRLNRGRQVNSAEAAPPRPTDVNAYIVHEYNKFSLDNFTTEEYMEKIIQFGFLMLFAASFPLAPLIALLTNLFDNATDAHRMLWNFRRPVAMMAQNIGMWHDIVEFLNVAGVISNACIIAFTASWVKLPQFEEMLNNLPAKLCIVLIVENVVLGLKYFISAVIPDVPSQVHLQMRRERYRVPKILNSGNINAISDGEESIASMVSLGSQLPSYVILRFYPNDGNMCVSFVF
ncbi:hypothetical protein BOX15_Mlig018999g1, partial [Macrostomum lignano]